MARALGSIVNVYVGTDKDGNPVGNALWEYSVVDGNAKKTGHLDDASPDYTKTYHNTGAVGEFWRDGVDAIKTAEGI